MGKMKSGEITGDKIKAIRKQTHAGALDCKRALELSDGNIEKAIEYLHKEGKIAPQTIWI